MDQSVSFCLFYLKIESSSFGLSFFVKENENSIFELIGKTQS
jgi:hypothetical protein